VQRSADTDDNDAATAVVETRDRRLDITLYKPALHRHSLSASATEQSDVDCFRGNATSIVCTASVLLHHQQQQQLQQQRYRHR